MRFVIIWPRLAIFLEGSVGGGCCLIHEIKRDSLDTLKITVRPRKLMVGR